MADNQTDNGKDPSNARYGFLVVLSGLIVLLIMFLAAAWRWQDAKDASAALGAVTSTIGTLVGAFFGFHAGEKGKDKAESERAQAEQKVERLAGLLPREDALKALGLSDKS